VVEADIMCGGREVWSGRWTGVCGGCRGYGEVLRVLSGSVLGGNRTRDCGGSQDNWWLGGMGRGSVVGGESGQGLVTGGGCGKRKMQATEQGWVGERRM
jgi:hypothetical protein